MLASHAIAAKKGTLHVCPYAIFMESKLIYKNVPDVWAQDFIDKKRQRKLKPIKSRVQKSKDGQYVQCLYPYKKYFKTKSYKSCKWERKHRYRCKN